MDEVKDFFLGVKLEFFTCGCSMAYYGPITDAEALTNGAA